MIIREQIWLDQRSQLERTEEFDDNEKEDEEEEEQDDYLSAADYYNGGGSNRIANSDGGDYYRCNNCKRKNDINVTATATSTATLTAAAQIATANRNHHSDCYCYHYYYYYYYCCYYYYCRYYRQQHHDYRHKRLLRQQQLKKKKPPKIPSKTTTVSNIVSPLLFLLLLCMQSTAVSATTRILPLWETQIMPSNAGRNIRHLPCVSRRTGETGLCMFAYSCAKANGTHLGTCIDRFYFGSCCKISPNDVAEILEEPISNNHLSNKEDPHGNNKVPPDDATQTSSIGIMSISPPNPVSAVSKPVSILNEFSTSTISQLITHSVKTTPPPPPAPPTIVATTIPVSTHHAAASSSSSVIYESIPLSTHRPMLMNATTHHSSLSSQTSSSSPSFSYTPATPPNPAGIGTYKPSSFYGSTNNNNNNYNNVSKPTSIKPPTTNKTKPKPSNKPPTSKPKPTSKPSTNNPKPVSTQSTNSLYSSSSTTHKYTIPPSSASQQASLSSYYNKTTSIQSSSASSPTTSSPPPLSSSNTFASSGFHTGSSTSKPSRPTTSSSSVVQTRPSLSSSSSAGGTFSGGSSSSSSSSTQKFPSTSAYYEYFYNKTSSSPTPSQVFGTRPTSSNNTPSYSNIGQTGGASSSSSSSNSYGSSISGSGSSTTGSTTSVPPHNTNVPSSGTLVNTDSLVIPSDRTKPPIKITMRPHPYETTMSPIDNMTEVITLSSSSSSPSPVVVLTSTIVGTGAGQNNNNNNNYSTTSKLPPSSTVTIPVASPLPIDPTTSVTLPDETNEIDTASVNMSDYRDVCGRRLFPSGRIVGGEKATFGKWPWQISLRQWRTSTYLHKCGAALFNENWAVTAAHCVENVPPSDLLLRLGEHDLSVEEEPYEYQERRVQIVASHPQFDPRTFEYDLALLRFYEPVKFQPNIIPICVPDDDVTFVGSTAHVTGWGRLYEDGPLPSVLQEVSVPVINNTVCESMYRSAGYIEHIPEIFICAGWRKGGFDSCEGDSGGPMVIQRPDKRWLLAGIISWGIGCAEPNQPGVYTRISEFRDWINQILQF